MFLAEVAAGAKGDQDPSPAAHACTVLAEHLPLPSACQLARALLGPKDPPGFPNPAAGTVGPGSAPVPTEFLHWRDLAALRIGACVTERLHEDMHFSRCGDRTSVPPAGGVPCRDRDQPSGVYSWEARGSTWSHAEQQAWLKGSGRVPGGPVLRGLAQILIRTRAPAADGALWRALRHLSPMYAYGPSSIWKSFHPFDLFCFGSLCFLWPFSQVLPSFSFDPLRAGCG